MSFSSLTGRYCHLTQLCDGVGLLCRNGAGDQAGGIVKQAEMKLSALLAEIFVKQAQAERLSENNVSQLAFFPKLLGVVGYLSEVGRFHVICQA